MWTKRFLLLAPAVLLILLMQSYFWVPTYEEQTKGNPKRLTEYITASSADAVILNPILSADSASAQIESLVFEGLVDRDENLNFRGRLAKSWKIYEEAYLWTKEDRISHLKAVAKDLSEISSVSVVQRKEGKAKIKLILKKVDPDIFHKLAKKCDCIFPPFEHNPVILFHLRKGVVFHDGYPFTAKDVKFTYEAIMDPKNVSPRISDFEPVKKVEVLDPFTVKVTYKRLYSPALSTWQIGILPEHLLNKEALAKEAISKGIDPKDFSIRNSSFNRHPIGCGPFKFVKWKSDQFIVLKRFEKYWEGPPNYKTYIFRVIPDPLTQEMEFYAGTIDHYNVLPHQVEGLKKDPRFQAFSGLSFGYTYIGYNMRKPPFNDVRVRRALGMAIDVDKIIKYVLYGQAERITGPFVKQTDYYDHSIKPLPYDPKRALKILEKAGWKRGKDGWLRKNGKKLQFTLITNNGNDIRKAILAIAQESWKKIGIDVRTELLEWSILLKRINQHDFDAVVLGWSMGIEPDLFQIFHSSQTHPYQLNFVGYKNKEADDLIVKIRQEYDERKRIKYCHMLHKIIARDQPYTFLYVTKWTAVLDKRIVIKEVDEKGHVRYKKITPTKTGDYTFYFNKWVKLPEFPNFSM